MTVYGKTIGGIVHRFIRNDAVKHRGRYEIPTNEQTKWVESWEEFRAAGGQTCWNGDQTEIELLLPEPYKFSIQFPGDRKE